MRNGYDLLTNEVATFVEGRLLMVVFPVRAALQAAGLRDLGEAVEMGVRDITLNVAKIVSGSGCPICAGGSRSVNVDAMAPRLCGGGRSADVAGPELDADPRADRPRRLGDRMLPCALARAAHHQQVAMAVR